MNVYMILSFFTLGAILYKLLGEFDLIYDFFFMAIILLVFIIFGIYNFITITYFIEDIGKIMTINSKTKELLIKKGIEEIKVKKSDVHKSYILESRKRWDHRDPFKLHKYAAILLKSGKLLIITNLIVEPLKILIHLKLNYTAIDQTFPRIDYQIGKQFSKENFERKV